MPRRLRNLSASFFSCVLDDPDHPVPSAVSDPPLTSSVKEEQTERAVGEERTIEEGRDDKMEDAVTRRGAEER